MEQKLGEHEETIKDYRTFDLKDEKVIKIVEENLDDGFCKQQQFHQQVQKKLDELLQQRQQSLTSYF